jgi:hypothetical protein
MRVPARSGSPARLSVRTAFLAVIAVGLAGGAFAQQRTPTPGDTSDADAAAPSEFKVKWDNTLTYGIGTRLRDQDKSILGLAAGGSGFSVNGDDGNRNYNKGLFTNAAKITSEVQFSYKDFGGFVRGFAFYDYENEKGDRARTKLSEAALDRVGSRAEFRDAFIYQRFKLGGRPAEIRAGFQVINWGESTFLQGGINAINPVDVSVLRVPGSELRDALLPVGAVKLSLKPSDSVSFEGFYQFTWEETKVDPVGSYFSTTDLAGAGAEKVLLGFGSAPDTIGVGQNIPGNPVGVAVPRVASVEPSEQGFWQTGSGAPSSGSTS